MPNFHSTETAKLQRLATGVSQRLNPRYTLGVSHPSAVNGQL